MSTAPRRADILYVIGAFQVGGAELHLARIAPEMVKRGWSVAVYSLAGDGALRGAFERGGVDIIVPWFERHKGSRLLLNRIARMASTAVHLLITLIRRRPKIVHFFLPESYLIGAPLAAIARVPVRVMSRRSLNVYQGRVPLWRAAERILHRGMTAILANSRRVADELRGEGVAPERLGLIYNGIDVARFGEAPPRERLRAELGIAPSALVMAIVANLIAYKGHADLLDALALAAPDLPPDWCLLVIGRDDGIGERLRAQAKALSIQDHVRFLDVRDDVPALLAASDIGIIVSHQEGFSNAVLEGMAAGLAMAVTEVGGNPEAVIDQEYGLVVPAKNPPVLARALVRLAGDPELRRRLGAAARRRIADRFALQRCVADYDALYRALIESGRLPPALRPNDDSDHGPHK